MFINSINFDQRRSTQLRLTRNVDSEHAYTDTWPGSE